MSALRSAIGGGRQHTDEQGGVRADTEVQDAAEELWEAYFADRSREHRNRLVLHYAPLVTVVARRFARRSRTMDGLEELCSFGRFGLIDAVERWDPSQGFRFSTYATTRIQGAMIDELRREDFLPKRLRARVQIYHVTRDELEARLHRSPTIGELAAELGIDVAEALALRDDATSLTHLAPLADGEGTGEGRFLGAGSPPPTPGEWVESGATADAVKAALKRLSERQRQVLVLHYLEGIAKSEIADLLGVGRPRVTQLVQQGLANLRRELAGPPAGGPSGGPSGGPATLMTA